MSRVSSAATKPTARGWVAAGGGLTRAATLVVSAGGYSASPMASRSLVRISVSFIGEHLRTQAQSFQRSVRARLGRLGRGLQDHGHLLEAEVQVVAKDEHQALVLRQSTQRPAQVTPPPLHVFSRGSLSQL